MLEFTFNSFCINIFKKISDRISEQGPIIYITSSSTLRRKGSGGFKEIDDVSIAAPLTKYSVMITDGNRIREVLDRAWTIATNGYPGAVHISVPVDIMFASYPEDAGKEERPFNWAHKPAHKAWPDPERLELVLSLIKNAKKPIFLVGHGVWWSHAEKALDQVSAELGIPVFNMSEHKKVLPLHAKACMGLTDIHQNPPAGEAFAETDVIIALGCVLDNTLEFGNPPQFTKASRLICINGSDEELSINKNADVALLSDPNAFLSALYSLQAKGEWHLNQLKDDVSGQTWLDLNQQRRRNWAEITLSTFDSNHIDREHSAKKTIRSIH